MRLPRLRKLHIDGLASSDAMLTQFLLSRKKRRICDYDEVRMGLQLSPTSPAAAAPDLLYHSKTERIPGNFHQLDGIHLTPRLKYFVYQNQTLLGGPGDPQFQIPPSAWGALRFLKSLSLGKITFNYPVDFSQMLLLKHIDLDSIETPDNILPRLPPSLTSLELFTYNLAVPLVEEWLDTFPDRNLERLLFYAPSAAWKDFEALLAATRGGRVVDLSLSCVHLVYDPHMAADAGLEIDVSGFSCLSLAGRDLGFHLRNPSKQLYSLSVDAAFLDSTTLNRWVAPTGLRLLKLLRPQQVTSQDLENVEKLLQISPSLQSLTTDSAEFVLVAASFSALRHLHLHTGNQSPNFLQGMSSFRNLVSLDFKSAVKCGFAWLKFPQLLDLTLRLDYAKTKLRFYGENLPRLRSLRLEVRCEESKQVIANFPELLSADVIVSSLGSITISQVPKLESLSFAQSASVLHLDAPALRIFRWASPVAGIKIQSKLEFLQDLFLDCRHNEKALMRVVGDLLHLVDPLSLVILRLAAAVSTQGSRSPKPMDKLLCQVLDKFFGVQVPNDAFEVSPKLDFVLWNSAEYKRPLSR